MSARCARFVTLAAAAVLSVFGGAAPVLAQSGYDGLRSLLGRVPQAALSQGGDLVEIGFTNGDAVRWIALRGAQQGLNSDAINRVTAERTAPLRQAEVITAYTDDELRAATGLQPSDWIEAIEVASPPVRLGTMMIIPDSQMRLRGSLFSRGFEMGDRGGEMVLWDGDVDHAAQPDRVDPANPFGGDLGLATRFVLRDDIAIWATGWPELDGMLQGARPTLADRTDLAEMVAALARAARGYGALASARIWAEGPGGDVTGVVAAAGALPAGMIDGVLLADIVDRTEETGLLLVAFAPGTDPAEMAARAEANWPQVVATLPGDDLPAPVIATHGGAHPAITLVLDGGWGADGATRNGFADALAALIRDGHLPALLAP